MKIGIIIATFNRKNLLSKLIINLNSIIIPNNTTINKIIVNDGSNDGTIELLISNYNDLTIINGNGNWWWTKCMNEGFKKAIDLKNDYVLILNDDIVLAPDYLKILIEDYNKLPKGSILGSSSISINKPHKIESAGSKKFIKWKLKFSPYYSGFKLVDDHFNGIYKTWTLSGRGTLIPVEVFNKIDFYDEKLIQYGSDDEFCIRANHNNIPVFISWNARVYNQTNLTSKGAVFKKEGLWILIKSFFNKYSVNSIYKHIYLYKKYGYPILLPIYIIVVFLGTIKAYYFNYNRE